LLVKAAGKATCIYDADQITYAGGGESLEFPK
jgi:hypothetical protein